VQHCMLLCKEKTVGNLASGGGRVAHLPLTHSAARRTPFDGNQRDDILADWDTTLQATRQGKPHGTASQSVNRSVISPAAVCHLETILSAAGTLRVVKAGKIDE
jgi:hypothetical protein